MRLGITIGGITISPCQSGTSISVRQGGCRVTKTAKGGTNVSVKRGNRRITKTSTGKTYITTQLGGGTSMRQRVT